MLCLNMVAFRFNTEGKQPLLSEIYLLGMYVGQHTEMPTYDLQDFTSWVNDTFWYGVACI